MPDEHYNVGGKTKWYGAALLRFSAHEFEADPEHQCLAWPFGLDEIAPYYDEAERLLHVNRFANEPRAPGADRQDRARTARAGAPTRCRSASSPRSSQDEQEAKHFDGYASVAGYKADAERNLIDAVAHLPNFTLLTRKKVIALLHEPGAPEVIQGVVCRDGSYYRADRVILAAGAMTSPRILQDHLAVDRPRRDAALAPRMVGANFKLHLNSALVAFSPFTHHDVLRKTAIFFNDALPAHHRAVPRLARRRDPRDPAAGRGAQVRHQRDRRARLRLLRHHRGRLAPRQPDRLRRRRRRHPDRRLQPRAPAARPGRALQARSPTSPGACCTSGSPASTAISASPAARMRWARW